MVRHRVEWIGSGISSERRGKRAEREERRGKRAEREERIINVETVVNVEAEDNVVNIT